MSAFWNSWRVETLAALILNVLVHKQSGIICTSEGWDLACLNGNDGEIYNAALNSLINTNEISLVKLEGNGRYRIVLYRHEDQELLFNQRQWELATTAY